MLDLQTAQQAANAIPGQGVITYAALALVLTNLIGLAKAGFKALAKRRSDSNVSAQGTGSVNVQVGAEPNEPKACPWHMEIEGRVSSVETMCENLTKKTDESRKENREDFGKVFGKIDDLADKIAALKK